MTGTTSKLTDAHDASAARSEAMAAAVNEIIEGEAEFHHFDELYRTDR